MAQANNQLGNHFSIQPDVLEKALKSAMVGGMKCRAGKMNRQTAEIHSPAIFQAKQYNCHGLQSCLAQIKVWA